jgi:uncharacterized protein (DUF362 family)
VEPDLLFTGKNRVATDTVSTALMSFDPTTETPNISFIRALNHLKMANDLGFGSNKLEEIRVLVAKIDEVKYKFNPAGEG